MFSYSVMLWVLTAFASFFVIYVKPKWLFRKLENAVIERFPLPIWYTTQEGKIIARSEKARKLLGKTTPKTLYTIVKREDRHLATYFAKMSTHGIERHVNLILKTKEKLRIFQTNHGPYLVWVFHKKSEHTPYLYPNQQVKLLNRHAHAAAQEAPCGIIIVDQHHRVIDTNKLFLDWFRESNKHRGENYKLQPAKFLSYFDAASRDDIDNFLTELSNNRLKEASDRRYKALLNNKNQTAVDLWGHVLPGRSEGSTLYIVYCQDISWERNLEAQFTHAQRMQALGQLSGSIAHDFNNILTGIIGFSDIVLSKFRPGEQAYTELMQIKQNAYRGANLVRQLLAFSKQQGQQMQAVNASELITELMPLFERLLGGGITLKVYLGRDLDYIKADPSQFEQIMMNLIVNARDALGDGQGQVTIRTNNLKLDSPLWLRRDRIEPGEYILVETIDTGCGIEKEQIDKIFDPFYTSKESGRSVGSGAGLGLATAYSLVKQANGYILVDSIQGEGTKFSIIWPKYAWKNKVQKPEDRLDKTNAANTIAIFSQENQGVIYLVEDDDVIRTFSARALQKKGYTVKSFSNAAAALKDLEQDVSKIDLLISDIMMPGMSGTDMACELYKRYPQMQTLFISGFVETKMDELELPQDKITFLPKPYDLKTLLSAVQKCLGDSESRQKRLKETAT